jgi:hypothetical protein
MIRKTLVLSALVLFTASTGAFACSGHQKAAQSMKPTTVADGGQSVPATPSTTKTQ